MNEPLEMIVPFLSDPEIIEIMIDGWKRVYVERSGRLETVNSPFPNEAALYELISAILTPMGRKVDESNPIIDARLPDGSRVNVVIPPISLVGPVVTLRKMIKRDFSVEDLIGFGSFNQDIADFLKVCVTGRLNIAVAGGSGSGKTTILHLLARWIPEEERIMLLQNAEEFTLSQERLVVLETRPANLEGRGEISMQDLVRNAMRMRPDRIVLGEMRGSEALDMLAAINSGHDGSLFSMHAGSPRDALARMEVMASFGNPSIPIQSLREQIASGLDLIVYQERLADSVRRITKIVEVSGVQDGVILTKDIFEFRRRGMKEGKIEGFFSATGAVPYFVSNLRQLGIDLPVSLFTPA